MESYLSSLPVCRDSDGLALLLFVRLFLRCGLVFVADRFSLSAGSSSLPIASASVLGRMHCWSAVQVGTNPHAALLMFGQAMAFRQCCTVGAHARLEVEAMSIQQRVFYIFVKFAGTID